MATVVTIAGVARSVKSGSLTYRGVQNVVGTASCVLESLDGSYRPAKDDEFIVTRDGVAVWGGLLNAPSEQALAETAGVVGHSMAITARDFKSYAERRFVINGGFPLGFPLITALTQLAGMLAPFGVTLHPSQITGPTLPLLQYTVFSVKQILDQLTDVTGLVWTIDPLKRLRMHTPGTSVVPFSVSDTAGAQHTVGDVTIEPYRGPYANRILLRIGEGQKTITDTFTGNGVLTAFTINYFPLVGHAGIIKVNGTPEIVTNNGGGGTWDYNTSTGVVTRTSAPPNGSTITFEYHAQFPVVVQANDLVEQATEPLQEVVLDASTVFDRAAGQAIADGVLPRFVQQPRTVKYQTDDAGVLEGLSQTISVSARNFSNLCWISEYSTKHIEGDIYRTSVTAIEGLLYQGTWRDSSLYSKQAGGAGGGVPIGAITIFPNGGVGGIGTAGHIAKWINATTLVDTGLTESAGALTGGATGAGFTVALSVSTITGTLADARLSSNVPLKNGANSFTGINKFLAGAPPNNRPIRIVANASGEAGAIEFTKSNDTTIQGLIAGVGDGLLVRGDGGHLTLGTLTGFNIIVDPAAGFVVPQLGYSVNLGQIDKKYLTLHAAELWVETLVAQNTLATIGGRVLVAPTNVLTADLAAAATSISVKYNNFTNGDRAYMEANGKVEFFAITSSASGSGPYTYTVTRNLDGSGANDWFAGDAMLNTGQAGSGFIDLYSLRGIKASNELGPTIVGNVRISSTYNDWAPRWAVGNLTNLYGYGGSGDYGAAFGNPAATHITIETINGIRIRNASTTVFQADTSGNLAITGNLTVGTSGVVRSAAATALGTGTGFYIAGGTTPVFRVGDPAGNRVSWDGTDLTLVSATIVVGASGITVSAPPTSLTTLYGYKFASALGGTNVVGLFSYEPTSVRRVVHVGNSCSAGGGNTVTIIQAAGSSQQALITLETDASNVTTIDLNAAHVRSVGNLYPSSDNLYSCGVASFRWTAVYAVNGAIQTSDRRAKTSVRDCALGIDFVRRLRVRAFAYVNDPTPGRVGFIAQEVADALDGHPFAALTKEPASGLFGLNYAGFVPVLVNALQDLDRRLQLLETP
jgi:hypothetical protein